ncbi:MAG: AgmX/PglI C-terminal domain-containing protein [Polyangiaceae bacterium]|nr:AgmX/PglI C-terminal domain-containing protein [Polyangiaceae bacterium]
MRKWTSACAAAMAATMGALAWGCGGEQRPVEAPQGGPEPAPDHGGGSGLGVESEIGAMDEDATQKTFEKLAPKLSRCFAAGMKRVPYLGGEVRLAVRVSKDGGTRWAFVKDSTLGDRETEECMLGVVRSASWPKPAGGEGLAENGFTFDPSPDERPPVAWSADQAGDALKKAQADLSSCRKEAGTGPLKATLYVDPDGKAVSVGVSGADERGEAAAKCVVEKLRELKLASPGSYDAKVSITID